MADDLVKLLTDALKRVREMDWTTWRPQPGDARIAEYLFGNQPPLTNGILQGYLADCAWVWQRPISPAEQQRARDGLVKLWTEDGLALDFSRLNEVLSFVWLFEGLQSAAPAQQEAVRQQLVRSVPFGSFPGIDVDIPGIAAAKQALGPLVPPSTLRAPTQTGVALKGVYLATTSSFQLDIYGRPGSGSWVSQTELYAFFPDGQYLYFPSRQEAGAHLLDPKGHKAYEGTYEVSGNKIKLYDGSNGQTNTSDFSISADRKQITFYGKTFDWISETTGYRK